MQATSIEGDGTKVTGVSLSDGRHIPADLVVVGVGVLPNVELAAEAGLPVASGIIVDEQLLTSDPDISAIGDCALFASPRFGAPLRLESVQNATDHARCVAARLTGDAKTYDGLPWFWSDQGPDKLQIAGLTTGYDRVVVRGDAGQGSFSAFCYKAGQLVGVESVNRASDHVFGRRILGPEPLDRTGAGGGFEFRFEGGAGVSTFRPNSRGRVAGDCRHFRRRRHRRPRAHPLHADRGGGVGVNQRFADRISGGQLRRERADKAIARACGVDGLDGVAWNNQMDCREQRTAPRLPNVTQMIWPCAVCSERIASDEACVIIGVAKLESAPADRVRFR